MDSDGRWCHLSVMQSLCLLFLRIYFGRNAACSFFFFSLTQTQTDSNDDIDSRGGRGVMFCHGYSVDLRPSPTNSVSTQVLPLEQMLRQCWDTVKFTTSPDSNAAENGSRNNKKNRLFRKNPPG